MSENGDESSDFDTAMTEDSPDDTYSDYGQSDEDSSARYYRNPLEDHVPVGLRSYVRKLSLDIAYLYSKRGMVIRKVKHHPVFQEQKETCMDYGCNKLTDIKCMTCHVFVCIDCFENFHETDD